MGRGRAGAGDGLDGGALRRLAAAGKRPETDGLPSRSGFS